MFTLNKFLFDLFSVIFLQGTVISSLNLYLMKVNKTLHMLQYLDVNSSFLKTDKFIWAENSI